MTEKVVHFKGRELIATLEEMLVQAKRGEISSMAYAVVRGNGSCVEGWTAGRDTFTLFASINVLRDQYFHATIQHTSPADVGPG